MDLQPGRDVFHQHEDGIRRQKRFRDRQATIRAIVQRALEELHRVGLIRVCLETEHEARERRDALTAHRIAFVRHR